MRTRLPLAFLLAMVLGPASGQPAPAQCARPPVPAGTPLFAGSLIPPGYLHTDGSQIVSADGLPVRIASVGWFTGFENPAASIAKMIRLGFNTVRIEWFNATMPADLIKIDPVVAAAKQYGLKVILDHHADEGGGACDSQQPNGLPIDSGPGTNETDGCGHRGSVTIGRFVQDWKTVAAHFAGNSTVIGFDLHNEPLHYDGQSTWGDGGVTDLRLMYQEAGNAIQAVNPGALIIAEGPQHYKTNFVGTAPAPYGDLSLAGRFPVKLKIPNQIVYSVHSYPAKQSGFNGPDSGPQAIANMNADFGYLVMENIAPVWIGEMGASMETAAERAWAQTLVDYMNGKAPGGPRFSGNQQGMSGDWWAWGTFDRDYPYGTLNNLGLPRPEQRAIYSQLTQRPICVPVSQRPEERVD